MLYIHVEGTLFAFVRVGLQAFRRSGRATVFVLLRHQEAMQCVGYGLNHVCFE